MTHLSIYERFLNDSCGVSFHWYLSDDKKLKWRDLTGPEKLPKIDIPTLFPSLLKKHELQALWTEFYRLVQELGKIECDADNFELAAKAWVRFFLTMYQTTDVTPYMHTFAMHVAEFLRLYGSIVMFTQLEKLNDITTKQYQRGTNHHKKEEPLRQIMEKRNRLEALEDLGYQRKKQLQKCSICGKEGHNRRSCASRLPMHSIN